MDNEVEIEYLLVDGSKEKITVSIEVAQVFANEKKRRKRHSMREYRHGSSAELGKVLAIRSSAWLVNASMSVEDAVLDNEVAIAISVALNTLSDTQRRRLILRYYYDLKLEEIAILENATAPAVFKSIEAGLAKLRKNIQKYFPE